MVDRAAANRGFTLVEMLAAMMILAFGITAVFGVFSAGVATEQQAALIRDAARLVTAVSEELQHSDACGAIGDPCPQPVQGATNRSFPGITYDLEFTTDSSRPWEILVDIRVRWLRRGATMSETYRLPLRRGRPLHVRLREEREKQETNR